MKILYVNACVRSDSRTDRLARDLLKTLGDYEEIRLTDAGLVPLDREKLEARTQKIAQRAFCDPTFAPARQFASADVIVMAAPFWDGSFPAVLKTYIEHIYVMGIVSSYAPDGTPVGLCRAQKLYYVTTAGGPYFPQFGYGYIEALAKTAFGIPCTGLIYAENLDIDGADPEKILDGARIRYGLA